MRRAPEASSGLCSAPMAASASPPPRQPSPLPARTTPVQPFPDLAASHCSRSCPLLGPPTSQELLWLPDPHGISSALLPLCCAPSPFLTWLSSFQLRPLCSPSWAPLQTLYPCLLLLPMPTHASSSCNSALHGCAPAFSYPSSQSAGLLWPSRLPSVQCWVLKNSRKASRKTWLQKSPSPLLSCQDAPSPGIWGSGPENRSLGV